MAEYINKTTAYEVLKKMEEEHNLSFSKEAYNKAAIMISTMPTEDVQPVIHARWEHGEVKGSQFGYGGQVKQSALWYCTNCGERIRYDTTLRTYQKKKKPVEEVHRFCRKCGAKMDEKEVK